MDAFFASIFETTPKSKRSEPASGRRGVLTQNGIITRVEGLSEALAAQMILRAVTARKRRVARINGFWGCY